MQAIITVGIALIFAGIAGPLPLLLRGDDWLVTGSFVFWFAVGLYVGSCCATVLARTRVRRREVRVRPSTPNATPFGERLAQFAKQQPDAIASADAKPVSRMPFWMAMITPRRSPPKHPSYLRRLLRRIRFALAFNKR